MAKDKRRDSFVYHLAWEDVLDNLPEEVREEVRGAIIGYARTGVTPELKPLAAVAFAFVRRDMDWDMRKYEDMVSARAESGRKGGSAKQSQATEAKQANASFAKQAKQSQATEAKQAIYEYDYEYDHVQHNVCCDGAQERQGGVTDAATSTPHTDFDFFFPTFWKANIHDPEAETRRFLDFYGAAGWTLEKGGLLDTDAKRLAKARSWKPRREGRRFPPRFPEIWERLAATAPEDIRRQMYADAVAVHMEGRSVCSAIEVSRDVKKWLCDGNETAQNLLLGEWLKGNGGRRIQMPVYD